MPGLIGKILDGIPNRARLVGDVWGPRISSARQREGINFKNDQVEDYDN